MIETERLLLRPPEPRDVDAVFRYTSDPEVMYWLGGVLGTRDDAIGRLESWQRAWELDGFGNFMVVPKNGSEAIGRISLLVWDPRSWTTGTRSEIGEGAEIELGWTVERAAWGNGYATEGALALRDWTLQNVAPPRLISLIRPDNVRSKRVAEKLGESYEDNVVLGEGTAVELWSLPH